MTGDDKKMNMQRPVKRSTSILERATDLFGIDKAFKGKVIDVAALPADPEVPMPEPVVETVTPSAPETGAGPEISVSPTPVATPHLPARVQTPALHLPPLVPGRQGDLDRAGLVEQGYIEPGGSVSGLSEEFRIVKREILRSVTGGAGRPAIPNGHRILVASANSGDGKTFCAVNLALSLAAESDHDVVLVDGDFAKPSIVSTLGLPDGPGLMDVLSDPSLPVADCVIQTDMPGLKVLPAGQSTNRDTELLAAARTETVLAQLEAGAPGRIVIFDSPPVLAASPAVVLAQHVGRVLLVVRADRTTEAALRDTVGLLAGCQHIELLLNGVKFSPGGRRFGTYYGQGA